MGQSAGTTFDLAIIGGGINGCGIARDAAGRGARVLLLERGDLAQGTSSASTKLIHGGLRYLEHREFALVREALLERERLLAIAPHLIRPLRFVLPHAPGLRPRWMLRLGLFVYDHLGGQQSLAPTQTIDLRRHPAGKPLHDGLSQGFVYSDCQVDDARLVVLNARDAADRGADVRTGCEVLSLRRDGPIWRIATSAGEFSARAVVNAAGPSVMAVLRRAGANTGRPMRLVRGSHIVVRRLFDHDYAYFFQLPDGRIMFAIPWQQDYTLIGTTDRDHEGSLDRVEASAEEVDYLCAGANRWFRQQITPADVVWTYAGVRPLVDDGSGRPEAATRGYSFDLSGGDGTAPLLSVFGGKITTYRHLAEAAIARLAPLLPVLAGPGWTAHQTLPGGDLPEGGITALIAEFRQACPSLDHAAAERVARAYGTLARSWLDTPGKDFGHGLTQGEVDYLVTKEWARGTDDILWRRTKLGLVFTEAETAALNDYLIRPASPAPTLHQA